MAYGFVYVLRNDSMPGIYKIGHTLRHPKERMAELARATACPTPFLLVAYFGCVNPEAVEREIHSVLAAYRVNDAREFFAVSPTDLLGVCCDHCDPMDAFYEDDLKFESYLYESEEERKWKLEYFLGQEADPMVWPKKFRGFD